MKNLNKIKNQNYKNIKAKKQNQSKNACDCEDEEEIALNYSARERTLKSDILSLSFNEMILGNECEIKGSPKKVLDDDVIETINAILNKSKFEKLSEEDAQMLLSDFVYGVCGAIGLNIPQIECVTYEDECEDFEDESTDDSESEDDEAEDYEELDSYENNGCYNQGLKNEAKYIKEKYPRKELNNFTIEITNPIYGESANFNALRLTCFSKEFFEEVNDILGVKKNILQKHLQPTYITTIRHECQHLYQYAKIREYFNGGSVEPKFKIMAISEVMRNSLLDYVEENGIEDYESELISYQNNCLEIDARHSEFVLLKSLIEDDRVSEHYKKSLKSYMLMLIKDFMLQDNIYDNINQFAKRRITMLKFEFEKEFGNLPLARFLINELNSINLDAYADEVKQYEKMYKDEYKKLLSERKQNKMLAEKQKKTKKIDKLNALYEF